MDTPVHFSTRLPKELNEYLQRRAVREDRSKNQSLITLIKEAQKRDHNES